MKLFTTCVSAPGDLTLKMVDQAKELDYNDFSNAVTGLDQLAISMHYVLDDTGLQLKNDYHVRYYKSRFNNKPCYFMVHSAIEYIFLNN